MYGAAVAERSKQAFGYGIFCGGQRERKALEIRLAQAVSVGGHDRRFADAQSRMHDLVFGFQRHVGSAARFGRVLVAHEYDHFGTDRLAIELDCFFAAAVKKQIRFDLHEIPRPKCKRFGIRWTKWPIRRRAAGFSIPIDAEARYLFLASIPARIRSSCARSSGVNSAPKSSASNIWRISISDSPSS